MSVGADWKGCPLNSGSETCRMVGKLAGGSLIETVTATVTYDTLELYGKVEGSRTFTVVAE
jgi:hypothetical protein